MTFTYVGDFSTDLDKVRFHIQDTIENSGPKPGTTTATNFTDEEINGVLSDAGSVDRAVAVMFDALSAVWSQYNDIRTGPRDEKLSQQSELYRKRADQWRKEHNILRGLTTAPMIKVDAYSDDITNDDVNTASEYGGLRITITTRD